MVVAKFESQRRQRINLSLSNQNPDETKWLLPNLNLKEGKGLTSRCRIKIPMRLNGRY